MKIKKSDKKLKLNKTTLMNLDICAMKDLKGGDTIITVTYTLRELGSCDLKECR